MQRYSCGVFVCIKTCKNNSQQISETKIGKHAANSIGDTDQLRNIKKWKSSKINLHVFDLDRQIIMLIF